MRAASIYIGDQYGGPVMQEPRGASVVTDGRSKILVSDDEMDVQGVEGVLDADF